MHRWRNRQTRLSQTQDVLRSNRRRCTNTVLVPVVQLVDTASLNLACCTFDSCRGHQKLSRNARLAQLVEATALEAVRSEFESPGGYQSLSVRSAEGRLTCKQPGSSSNLLYPTPNSPRDGRVDQGSCLQSSPIAGSNPARASTPQVVYALVAQPEEHSPCKRAAARSPANVVSAGRHEVTVSRLREIRKANKSSPGAPPFNASIAQWMRASAYEAEGCGRIWQLRSRRACQFTPISQ